MPIMMAAVMGGVSLLSTSMSSKKGKAAAKDIKRAAIAQKRENEAAYTEQKQMLAPWMEAGTKALRDIQVGMKNGSFDPGKFQFDAAAMEKDPGYQFRMKEGERLAAQRIGARGKYFSTEGQGQLNQTVQDIASQEYGNAYGRAANEYQMESQRLGKNLNVLQDMSVGGQNTATNVAGMRGNLAVNNANQTQNIMSAREMQGQAEAAPWNALAEMSSTYAGSKA